MRSVVPRRLLTTREAELVAELQANCLLELAGLTQAPIPNELVTELPRIAVRLDPDLPVSGSAQRAGGRWLLSINASEPWTRQRFSLLHELKQVLDHPYVQQIYAGDEQAEHLADYFAACVLMPRRYVKRVWGEGMQSLAALSNHFGVSERALALRLQHLGLRAPLARHQAGTTGRSTPRRQKYERSSYFLVSGSVS